MSIGVAKDGVSLLQFTMTVEKEAAEVMGCDF